MKNAWLLLATLVPAWGLTVHQKVNPAVVQMDIQRKDVINPVVRDQVRRKRSTITQTLDNEVRLQVEKLFTRSILTLVGDFILLQYHIRKPEAKLSTGDRHRK